ncbi:MAG TPA: hypothetical protein VF559_03410 [Caulobacteraceae bacterium]
MSAAYHFVEAPAGESEVLGWFRSLNAPPEEVANKIGRTLYFREFGPLAHAADGSIDTNKSPVITVALPNIRRGVLWSVGEVHFLASNLRAVATRFEAVHRAFKQWIEAKPLVFENNRRVENPHAYYLEGGSQNFGSKIWAMPSGLEAILAGQYFVSHRDNNVVLDKVCRSLALRGIECQLEQGTR